MTEKRVDIEVVDKVAPNIDDKILAIAKSAREAFNALTQLESVMRLVGSSGGKDLLRHTERMVIAEAKAALSQQKLQKEIVATELLKNKSIALINKEIEVTNRLAKAREQFKPVKSAKDSAAVFSMVFDAKDKQNAQAFQTQINSLLGVNREVSKSANESAKAFIEQAKAEKIAAAETAQFEAQARALKNMLDPLSVTQKTHTKNVSDYDKLLSKNLITSNEHQRLVDLSKKSYDSAAKSISIMGNSSTLSAFQLQNLSYQMQDIVVGLYSGQSPLTVLVQQGLQIQQIFGQQGFIGALKGIGGYLRQFITIGTVGFTSVAAAVTTSLASLNLFIKSEKEAIVALSGLGAYSKITLKQFNDLSKGISETTNISITQARSLNAALIASGNASIENLSLATSNVKNLAATLRTDVEGASKVLEELFASPEAGVKKLNQQLNFADVATVKQINNLIAQGKAQEAITLAMEKVTPALVNAENASTGFSRLWTDLTNTFKNGTYWFGQLVDKIIYGQQNIELTDGSIASYNKLSGQAQELVGKFDEWNKGINEARNSMILIDRALEQTTEKLSNVTDEVERENLQKFVNDLTRVRDIYNTMGASLEMFGDATARAAREQELEIKMLKATDAATRAKIAREQEAIRLTGQGITGDQFANSVKFAGNVILENRNKLVNDEITALREQTKLVGLVGVEYRVENELLSNIQSKRQSGNALSQKEIATYRDLLRAKQEDSLQQQANDTIYENSIGKIQSYQRELSATNLAFNKGWINGENYALRLNKISLAVSELRLNMGNGDFIDATNAALGKMVSNYEGVLPGLSSSFGDFFVDVQNGFANSIGRAIVMSEDLSTSLRDIAQSALSELIGSLVKLGIQYAVNAALGHSVAIAATAASTAQASLLASAWAPAAAMASLATSGANAAGAATGLASVSALAQTLATAVPAFASGGSVYGPGTATSDSILARLSNGEFVVNAKAANENRPLLDHLNNGGKFDTKQQSPNINISVINNSNAAISVERINETEIRIIAEQEANKVLAKNGDTVFSSQIANPNSKTSRALGTNLTASRRR